MADTPLIFVHGWATDKWVWEEAGRGLSETAININLPGHGGQLPWDEPSLLPAIREIKEGLRPLGRTKAIGVGWSLGSMALINGLSDFKESFKALVLVGSTPCFVEKEDFPWGQPKALVKRMLMDMKKEPAPTLERFYRLNFTEEEQKTSATMKMMDRYAFPGPVTCEGTVPGCFPAFRYEEMTKALEALYMTDLREELKTIDIPVLLVHGRLDSICPVGAAEYMGSRIKGAKLEIIESAGHAPHITRPELFNKMLHEFLATL